MRRFLTSILIMLAAVVTFSAPAAAAQTRASDAGIAGAAQCIDAPGPGDVDNNSCLDVRGESIRVETAKVSLESYVWPYLPTPICDLKVDVWGTLPWGEGWSQTHTIAGCPKGISSHTFEVHRNFAADTYFCGRTTYRGKASDANCIIIKW